MKLHARVYKVYVNKHYGFMIADDMLIYAIQGSELRGIHTSSLSTKKAEVTIEDTRLMHSASNHLRLEDYPMARTLKGFTEYTQIQTAINAYISLRNKQE